MRILLPFLVVATATLSMIPTSVLSVSASTAPTHYDHGQGYASVYGHHNGQNYVDVDHHNDYHYNGVNIDNEHAPVIVDTIENDGRVHRRPHRSPHSSNPHHRVVIVNEEKDLDNDGEDEEIHVKIIYHDGAEEKEEEDDGNHEEDSDENYPVEISDEDGEMNQILENLFGESEEDKLEIHEETDQEEIEREESERREITHGEDIDISQRRLQGALQRLLIAKEKLSSFVASSLASASSPQNTISHGGKNQYRNAKGKKGAVAFQSIDPSVVVTPDPSVTVPTDPIASPSPSDSTIVTDSTTPPPLVVPDSSSPSSDPLIVPTSTTVSSNVNPFGCGNKGLASFVCKFMGLVSQVEQKLGGVVFEAKHVASNFNKLKNVFRG